LEVEIMNFTMPDGDASDNVIATLPGTVYPYEYVVIGGHYDSYSFSGAAPGADDNASGTAGVMEIARILSNYEFERTIVFCAFSGEEYGLYGSAAYAQRSVNEDMNILGYFNMDMIGYLKPGHSTIMTSLIYPPSAQPLADFYTDVTALYLPDFEVQAGNFTQGDSDHTSFNNNGYMGIFPFEDVNNYSPYIHTSDDLIGPSYNNQQQAVIFTKAILASAVTMAGIPAPAGISENIRQSLIYPNPAHKELTVYLPAHQPASVSITALSGQVLIQTNMVGTSRLKLPELTQGFYLLIIEGENFREVHKLVIE
ncbi:MAG: M28 family peptidase, partial [Bacteroidota bacterium]